MFSLSHLPAVVLVVLCVTLGWVAQGQDVCQRCECLPLGEHPTQAICHGVSNDKAFTPSTSDSSSTLELIYIYAIAVVHFNERSLNTDNPVTLLIQNCTEVTFSDRAVTRLRTLVVREVTHVIMGILDVEELWALVLENIRELIIDSASLVANYSVSIGHIDILTFHLSSEEDLYGFERCNPESAFTLFDTTVALIPTGGLPICAGHIMINNNTFNHLSTSSVVAKAEESLVIIYNHFENLTKQALNLSAPVIHITNNMFDTLPAGALRDVQTYQDTFFVNNTIQDVDLGGVLLDMSWEMVIEHNQIFCDCAFKRTSILNPRHDMLYLTNSSSEKLNTIFLNNYCYLNCSVNLLTFSHALILGDVCLSNLTQLEQEKLCNISETIDYLTTEGNEVFASGTATRAEFLVLLGIIVVSLLLTSSICFACCESRKFHFKFTPGVESSNKFPLQ